MSGTHTAHSAGSRFGDGIDDGGDTALRTTPLMPSDSVRSAALRTIDARRDVADEVRHLMASTVDRAEPEEQPATPGTSRRPVVRRMSPRSASCCRPDAGHREFTDTDLRAFQRVQQGAGR